MKTNKAQAAMEYLMTYGWAILIVVVVVAALYALGVFTPTGARVPCSPCFASGDLAYVDYSTGSLIVRTGPRDMRIDSVTANPDVVPVATSTSLGSSVTPGTDVTITNIDTTAGSDIILTISYTVITSGLSHTDSATIHN